MNERRQRLLRLRAAIAVRTGHRLGGFLSDGTRLPVHDTRGPDGSCRACALLARLDMVLYPDADVRPSSAAEEPSDWVSRRGPDRRRGDSGEMLGEVPGEGRA